MRKKGEKWTRTEKRLLHKYVWQKRDNKEIAKLLKKSLTSISPMIFRLKKKGWVFPTRAQRIAWAQTGHTVSEESRKKISIANTGNPKIINAHRGRIFTLEHRKNISEAAKNRPPMSEETRRKLSEAGKNRAPKSEETRRKTSESLKGHIVSEETRKKISEANKGKEGRKLTEEERKNLSESRKGDKNPAFKHGYFVGAKGYFEEGKERKKQKPYPKEFEIEAKKRKMSDMQFCEMCGHPFDYKTRKVAHHLDYDSHDLKSLRIVCPDCHYEIHFPKKKRGKKNGKN